MQPLRQNTVSAPIDLEPLRAHLPLPKALLCDLDGTLIDTMPTLADLASEIMAEVYGMEKPLARQLYLGTCGLPFFRQLDAICPGDPRNAAVAARFESEKPARCARARMTAGTRAALASLRERGVRVIVSSNNGSDNVATFAERNPEFRFDMLLGFGGGLAKGGPHVKAVCERFGLAREQLLFIGDSLHDGEIADRDNLAFVGIAGTFSREQFTLRFSHRYPVVDQVADLPALFARPATSATPRARADRFSASHNA